MTNLILPIFTDPEAARVHLEALHWPFGPICPHCGTVGKATLVKGKSHRPGMYQCNSCREPFTVTVGTVIEKSHIPLNKWVLGFHLMVASKKGISAHQLYRMLGLGSYRSAWFMAMRIREAMTPAKDAGQIGGPGKLVESDETELGLSHKTKRRPGRRRAENKRFVSPVERGCQVRSRKITGADGYIGLEVQAIIFKELHPESMLHTDYAWHYPLSVPKGKRERVNHSKEYVAKGNDGSPVHTNSAEGYFSIVKRGLVGTYQHMREQPLPRHLAEFDFRMNNRVKPGVNDTMRAEKAIKDARDKRLTYFTVSG